MEIPELLTATWGKQRIEVAWVSKSCIEPQEQLLHMIRDEVGSSGA